MLGSLNWWCSVINAAMQGWQCVYAVSLPLGGIVNKVLFLVLLFCIAPNLHYLCILLKRCCKVKLHIFNPEHEMALAADAAHVALPHAVQEFKTNLGFLPALWADDGDFVLVDDVLFALKALAQCRMPHADVLFVSQEDMGKLVFSGFEPWGWDKAVRRMLADAGMDVGGLPSDEYLDFVRSLADRRNTTDALLRIRSGLECATCGESRFCKSLDEVLDEMDKYGVVVVKALWSSSGRGVRYVDKGFSASLRGWMSNTIGRQGGVMVEPYYKKVKDFALEFYSHGDGRVDYCGLSLFETNKSSYAGNVVAAEEEKAAMLARFVPAWLLNETRQRLLRYFSEGAFSKYSGPLGVDMMAVARDDGRGFLLHPCVEINVRRTMGHVANSFGVQATEPAKLMRIVHDVNYKLKFDTIGNNFVKVI